MPHWLDHVYIAVYGRARLFAEGWGDLTEAELFAASLRPRPAPVVRPHLARDTSRSDLRVYDGTFESPVTDLPDESRRAVFRLILPHGPEAVPVAVFLAASGDEGYARRTRLTSPLVQRGLGVLILENPLYGARRPDGQPGTSLRTFADQLKMSRATVEEATALLAWLGTEGHPVGVAGYSQGGTMSSYVTVRSPTPLVTVIAASGADTAAIFTRNFLGRHVCWEKLGGGESAREQFARCLDPVALDRLPPPPDGSRTHLIGYSNDGWVSCESVEALHRHWTGSSLAWVDTGHVAGFVRHAEVIRATALRAFNLVPVPA